MFEWAVADFIKKNYDLSDVFRGTQNGNWKDLSELSNIMIANLQDEFTGFNSEEMITILYYVCRIEQVLRFRVCFEERQPLRHVFTDRMRRMRKRRIKDYSKLLI